MSNTTVRGADGRLYLVSSQEVSLIADEPALEMKPVMTLGKRADRTDEASAEYAYYP